MQLRFFDYLVLIVAYMFVSLRGDKVMKLIKFDKLSSMIPLGKAESSALLHALFFVIILAALNALASQIATMKGKERSKGNKAGYCDKGGCGCN